jgi:S-DNA-T family DNA segregation ATPase FtsK/SpoIIIE
LSNQVLILQHALHTVGQSDCHSKREPFRDGNDNDHNGLDEEVEEIVTHLKSYGPPVYMSGVVEGPDEDAAEIDSILGLGSDGLDDTLYDQAVAIVAKDRKCSTSYIQRKLGIGYNKAAKLVEQMEEHSVVTPANHVGKREILIEER